MTEVKYLADDIWDGNAREIFVHAQLSDRDGLIRCRVPSEILRDFFGANSAEQMVLKSKFSHHRIEIEKIMTRLIQAKRFESDGSVVVKQQDISRNE